MRDSMGGQWNLVGHERVVELVAPSIIQPSHAYLFTGPRHIGKLTMAIELAKALNCEASEDERPCQMCLTCRLIGKSGHPDVTVLEPEPDKERISIDAIRPLRQELALQPMQGRFRVAVIRGDQLTDQAAEALLKTLEEPNPQVVLVLTGVDIQSIPETIQSRCRCAVMTFVATEEIRDELIRRDVDSGTAERLAALSYGAVGWAIDASQDDAMAARRSVLRNDLVKWSGASLKERLAVAESLPGDSRQSDKARVAVLEELEILITWWRDILLASTGQSDLIVNTAFRAEIEEAAARERPESALAVIRSVAAAATRIGENVDPRLTLEALAVAL